MSKYRISANSFRGNYSFLKLFGQRSQYISIKFPLHKPSENCGNYSREETIQGRKLFAEIWYFVSWYDVKHVQWCKNLFEGAFSFSTWNAFTRFLWQIHVTNARNMKNETTSTHESRKIGISVRNNSIMMWSSTI